MSLVTQPLHQVVDRIAGVAVPEPIMVKPSECACQSFRWPEWGDKSGIYSFEKEGKVLYIGRALGASLKQRLRSHCTSRDNEAWVEAMESLETQVYVFPFPEDSWYWVASVEAKLNSDIRTVFGRRIS